MRARALVKRGACYGWLTKFDEAVADFTNIIETPALNMYLSDMEVASLKKDLAVIQARQKSIVVKQEGDKCFFREAFDDAIKKYEEALEVDKENEYAIANIGVINLKRLQYQECIDQSTKALHLIENFHNETRAFSKQNFLEVKLLLRRAKSYEMTEQWELAKADLDKTLVLEPKNGEARANLKVIQSKLDEIVFSKYREEANDMLKNRKFQQALDLYEKALRVTRKASTLDNIAVFVNKLACLLSLDKLDRVITESNEAIRLIRNYRNRFNVKGEERERLQGMDLRVAVRKGNALAKLARVSEAITEYERALTIQPDNAQVKKDLDILRQQR